MLFCLVVTAGAESQEGTKKAFHEAPHKPLYPPDKHDFIAFSLAAVGLVIASLGRCGRPSIAVALNLCIQDLIRHCPARAGGIGGGGILVPLYILVLGFDSHHAGPLSTVTIVVRAWMFLHIS
jgi:hypothetical protein